MQVTQPQHSSVSDLLKSLQKSGVSQSELQLSNLQRAQKVGARQSKAKQEKAYRKTNYETVSSNMDKWVPIIKINREKPHLDFTQKSNNHVRVNFFQSSNDNFLTKRIEGKLHSIGVGSQSQLLEHEEKILKDLDPEVAQERIKEAVKRSTVFHQEIRRKRISKIKSKLYRRIKKKQKQKEELARMQNLGAEQRQHEMDKLRSKRIQERISLRHKSKNKHIQDLMKFQKGNKNVVQSEINELNRTRREQLERLNQEMLDDISEEYDDQNFREQALKDLEEQLQMLDQEEQNPNLTGLKFMDKKYLSDLQNQKSEGERLREALANDQDLQFLDQQDQEDQGQRKPKKPLVKQPVNNDQPIVRKKYEKQLKSRIAEQPIKKSKTSMKQTLSQYIIQKQTGQQKAQVGQDDSLIRGINTEQLRTKYEPKRMEKINMQELVENNPDLFENFQVMENRRQFQQEKMNQFQADLPEKPKVVKGWGSWAGPGIAQPKTDPKKQLEERLKQIEQIKRKRKDGLNQDVIIRQTRNKVFARDYLVTELPYNYKSKEQFDYLHQQPLGLEWNSMSNFQETIKPKIRIKSGETIQPISLPRKIAKLQ